MRILWCWRCRLEVPMLDDDEWAVVRQAHLLSRDDLAAADALLERERVRRALLPIPPMPDAGGLIDRSQQYLVKGYALFTGVAEQAPNAIWHHVTSLYGPPCEHCGKPLRTPRARWCPACGGWRSGAPTSAG
jgi:hypothetical protein